MGEDQAGDGGSKKTNSKAAGGIARAASLTSDERTEIAKKAAAARWRDNLPRATHEGTLKIGDLTLACSVLEDETRVLTETKFMEALGMYRSGALSTRRQKPGDEGAQTPLYLAYKNLKPFVSKHMKELHKAALKYRTLTGQTAHGIRAEIIPIICEVWLDARTEAKAFGERQKMIAARAEVLSRGLSRTGIIALIDEATGYQAVRPKDALQRYLEMILRKTLAAWSKRFPDEFYENIYKLKGWPWPGMGTNRYSVVALYTKDLIYDRLAPGLYSELCARSPRNENGYRKNKLHQWLNEDIGNPMLAQHIYSILMFQRLAISSGFGWTRFVRMVDRVHARRGNTLELPLMEND